MADDEKTAESAAGLVPEPSERRDPIEQIRQMHAEVHSVHPADPAECNCSKCALLAEIDRLREALTTARLAEQKRILDNPASTLFGIPLGTIQEMLNIAAGHGGYSWEKHLGKLQAQLGAVVEECAAIAESEPVAHGWDGKRWWHSGEKAAAKIRSLHPPATKALARRVLEARREEAAHWHDSSQLSAGCFVGICPGCTRLAEIDAQLAALDKENPRP